MVQINRFPEFYNLHSKVFRCFGVIPLFKKSEGSAPPKRNVLILGIILTVLVVYWTGVVFAFLIKSHMNDKISIISNWIQILTNSLALTTTLGSTAFKYADYEKIISQFQQIDENLLFIGHKINYSKHLRSSKNIFFMYLGAFCGIMAYDFYITVKKYQMTSLWYWLVSVFPLLIYSVGIIQALFMISWIHCRCSMINKVLKKIRINANGGRGGTPESKVKHLPGNIQSRLQGCLFVQPHTSVQQPAKLENNSRNLMNLRSEGELHFDNLIQLFLIMNDLCKLARKVDEYYGLFLLTSISALFAITTIQVYYCYVTIIVYDDSLKYSVWTLIVSVNLVTINLSLIVGLCSVCENVSNEAKKILHNISALRFKKVIVYVILCKGYNEMMIRFSL